MFKFVLILSLCYIVVECNTIKRRGGCNKIFTCISPLNNLGPEDFKDFSNAAFYDQFCQPTGTGKTNCSCLVTSEYKVIVWSTPYPDAFTFPNISQVPIRAGRTQRSTTTLATVPKSAILIRGSIVLINGLANSQRLISKLKSQTFSSCFRDARVECDHQGVLNDYESLVGVADFLCTDESRDDVSFLINLECASSELKIVELVQSFEGCRLIFDNDMNLDFCPLMHQFSGCLVNIATEKCGSRAGGFVSRLFNVAAAAELGELGCGAQARNARSNIDTIVPLLAKAAKLRR